ncbi:unnamed protein product [Ixodes persulcatus]
MAKLNDDASFFLISLVEEFPALWDISSELYSKTNLKASIWEKIAEEMFARFPQFAPYTVDFLKGYLQNKRRTYRDERKKILKTKSGQAAEEAYSGKWKFFSALRFLDGATTRAGMGMSSFDFAGDSDERSPEDVLSPAQSPEPSPGAASAAGPALAEKESASAPPKKRRRVDGAELSLMEQRTAALTRLTECMEAPPPAPDDSAAFGMVVAEYLRSMSLAARARCQISVLSAIAAHLD